MIRYRLSRLFSDIAQHWMPGDRFLGASATQLMEGNRNLYRDQLIETLDQLYSRFDSGLMLESRTTGTGEATLRLSSPAKYPGYYPAEFAVKTESSDLLMATGRLAAFHITPQEKVEPEEPSSRVFYYGNAFNPDNQAALMGTPPYLNDANEIARYLHQAAFAALYARYSKKDRNAGTPAP